MDNNRITPSSFLHAAQAQASQSPPFLPVFLYFQAKILTLWGITHDEIFPIVFNPPFIYVQSYFKFSMVTYILLCLSVHFKFSMVMLIHPMASIANANVQCKMFTKILWHLSLYIFIYCKLSNLHQPMH